MAQYVATRRLTLAGKTYERGDVVKLDRATLPPGRLKQLVEQRRIAADEVRVSSGQKER